MVRVGYKPAFIRALKKLPPLLQREAKERIAEFKEDPTKPSFRAHKLSSELKGVWSFSVNYSYRILFEYVDKQTVVLLTIGDHDIYK